ncbi:MAG: hypothetical protein ACLQVG_20440 [Terriglobia bacterium]
MRSFGVRQLAAAFHTASLLAESLLRSRFPTSELAGESGSKLPHSKAAQAGT